MSTRTFSSPDCCDCPLVRWGTYGKAWCEAWKGRKAVIGGWSPTIDAPWRSPKWCPLPITVERAPEKPRSLLPWAQSRIDEALLVTVEREK